MANVKRKSRSRAGSVVYTVFLLLYIAAISYVVVWGLGKLWVFAEEYENSRSEPVIESYMESLRDNLWDDAVAQTVSEMPHEFQTDEECAVVIKEILNEEISYRRATGATEPDVQVYQLLCGQNLFGKVTLVQDRSKVPDLSELGEMYNCVPWVVYKEEFYLDGLYTGMQITVPSKYKVTLNGHELSQDYIVEKNIPFDVLESYYDEYPGLPTKVTYRADNIFGHLKPEVYNENGEKIEIDPNRDDSQFIPPIDGAMMEKLRVFAEEFSNAYLAFNTGVSDMNGLYAAVMPYVVEGSDLDQRMKGAIEGYVGYQHNQSYQFGSATLDNAVYLGGDYYVIDVTATATALQPQGTVEVERNLKISLIDNGHELRAFSAEG